MPTRGQPAGAASLTVGRPAGGGTGPDRPVATGRHRHWRATMTRRPEVTPVDDQTGGTAPDGPGRGPGPERPFVAAPPRHGGATMTRPPEVTPVDAKPVATAPDVPRLELDPTVP